MAILARVINSIGPLDSTGLSPQRYGTIIHQNFANVVRAAGIAGIGYDDVETTFPEGESYGALDSIRTDVVLRDDNGNVIAIYDVKTGNADISPSRAAELRAKIGAPDAYVIEIRRYQSIAKIDSAQLR
jgi:hypothetical protein